MTAPNQCQALVNQCLGLNKHSVVLKFGGVITNNCTERAITLNDKVFIKPLLELWKGTNFGSAGTILWYEVLLIKQHTLGYSTDLQTKQKLIF